MPPILESFVDSLGGHSCYTGLDLFVAFDHRSSLVRTCDLTTFQTPLGLLQLTSLPMGVTNSVQILQGDISFILQDEMPDMATAFMDEVNIKGPPTHYETTEDGQYTSTTFTEPPLQSHLVPCALGPDSLFYEVTAENSGICRFICDHVNDMNRILQQFKKAGGCYE